MATQRYPHLMNNTQLHIDRIIGLQPFIWEMVGEPYKPVYVQLRIARSDP